MPSGLILSEEKNPYLHLIVGENGHAGEDRMNPGIRILPLTSATGLPGGRMSG